MAKQYKIKRYRQYGGGNSFRAKPHPVVIVLGIIAIAVLLGAGYLLFDPISSLLLQDFSSDIDISDPELELTSEAPAEPEPDAPSTVTGLRAVSLPFDTARDSSARNAFLDGLAGTGINAVMVDIKNEDGYVLFQTRNQQAADWNAVVENPVNLSEVMISLDERNLALIVRLSAFRDPLAAGANRDIAITYQDTDWLWLDAAAESGGRPWLNPYASGSQEYITSLALEAAGVGASMVVLENLQFPTGSTANATFGPLSQSITRTEVLKRFVDSLSDRLMEDGVRTAVSLTTLSISQETENATRYGGSPLDIVGENLVLSVLPYQFGGDYTLGEGFVLESPTENPGGAVDIMLRYVMSQLPADVSVQVLPLVQGGAEPSVSGGMYTRTQIDAQLSVAGNHGLEEYILYTTTGEYTLQ